MILEDEISRARIKDDLRTSLFVEAGAGSGKTTALVGRVLSLVLEEETDIRSIVAITFTEKAANELRERLIWELKAVASDSKPSSKVRQQRAVSSLNVIDQAPIGTIHSFSRRILTRLSSLANLPAEIAVMDTTESEIDFEKHWSQFMEQVLSRDSLKSVLSILLHAKRSDSLRDLAKEMLRSKVVIDSVRQWCSAKGSLLQDEEIELSLNVVLDIFRKQLLQLKEVGRLCKDPDDSLLGAVTSLVQRLEDLLDEPSSFEILEVLTRLPNASTNIDRFRLPRNMGRQSAWMGSKKELVDSLNQFADQIAAEVYELIDTALRTFIFYLTDFVIDYRDQRRSKGRLSFDDLIDFSIELLCDPIVGVKARRVLYNNFKVVMLDEFQDTDPAQILLASLVTTPYTEAFDRNWDVATPTAGRLFLVGDPKQAIYRFRGADLSVFYRAQRRLTEVGESVKLVTNFRSTKGVCDFINDICYPVFQFDRVGSQTKSSVTYEPLRAVRISSSTGPSGSFIGRKALGGEKDVKKTLTTSEVRGAEAQATAAAILKIVEERWSIRESFTDDERPASFGDITVLVPKRTALSQLEVALKSLKIPYVLDVSVDILSTQLIRTLILTLWSIWDPADEVNIVSVLKSFLFHVSNEHLVRHRIKCQGTFRYLDKSSNVCACPVGEALSQLAALRSDLTSAPVNLCITKVIDHFTLFESTKRLEDWQTQWKRLEWFIDQAVYWTSTTSDSLGAFLRYIQRLLSSKNYILDKAVKHVGDDAVTISTIHGAKGLEYPICIVSAMSTSVVGSNNADTEVLLDSDHQIEYKFMGQRSKGYTSYLERQKNEDLLEAQRLLYVAFTRARDHLVVSLFRDYQVDLDSLPSKVTYAQLVSASVKELSVFEDTPDLFENLDTIRKYAERTREVRSDAQYLSNAHRLQVRDSDRVHELISEYEDNIFNLAKNYKAVIEPIGVTSASKNVTRYLGDDFERSGGEVEGGEVPDLQSLNRPGKIGSALHYLLKLIDLNDVTDLPAVAEVVCKQYGCLEYFNEVVSMATAAMTCTTVRKALDCGAKINKEVFVSRISDESRRWFEGFIDLLIEYEDHVEIVDFKSAAVLPKGRGSSFPRYSYQLALYGWTLGSTYSKVVRGKIIYLAPEGAKEVDVDIESALKRLE